jgi:hypothetical protein
MDVAPDVVVDVGELRAHGVDRGGDPFAVVTSAKRGMGPPW